MFLSFMNKKKPEKSSNTWINAKSAAYSLHASCNMKPVANVAFVCKVTLAMANTV